MHVPKTVVAAPEKEKEKKPLSEYEPPRFVMPESFYEQKAEPAQI